MVSPMTREQIFYKVCEIIKNETPVEADMEIKMDTLLTNDMELDSLDLLDISLEAEREFGIKIPDDDFYKLNTYSVGELCGVIEREMTNKTNRKL